ncbi:MAG TPA: hypothetical protein VGM98_20000 [Schlesneria sp.]
MVSAPSVSKLQLPHLMNKPVHGPTILNPSGGTGKPDGKRITADKT